MTAWWAGRSDRERILLAAMALLASAFILYQFILTPLASYRETSARRLGAASALYHEVSRGAAQIESARQAQERRPARAREANMRTTITVSAHHAQITITRLEPQGDGLAVWINAAPAPDLHRWIAALSRDFGITVQKATINRVDDVGGSGGAAESEATQAPVRAQLVFAEGRAS